MAGFTADPQGRPRSNVPPPEEAEPLIRPFVGVEQERAVGPGQAVEVGGVVCMDTGAWGRQQAPAAAAAPLQPSSLDDDLRRIGGWGADENVILATGGGGGGGGGMALGRGGGGSSSRNSRVEAATRALFVGGVRRLARGWEELARVLVLVPPLLVLRMGEWSKFKYWSKASYDMDWEWRRDYQKARNQTLRDREEMMRVNGTDPWAPGGGRQFDWELWTILRTLSGQNGINNRF